jgi:hypothetical protein
MDGQLNRTTPKAVMEIVMVIANSSASVVHKM